MGGIAYAIFVKDANIHYQLLGSLIIPLWGFCTAYILFLLLYKVKLLRVNAYDELRGLDVSMHREEAYKESKDIADKLMNYKDQLKG
jgi:Amt family ammonium transporter